MLHFFSNTSSLLLCPINTVIMPKNRKAYRRPVLEGAGWWDDFTNSVSNWGKGVEQAFSSPEAFSNAITHEFTDPRSLGRTAAGFINPAVGAANRIQDFSQSGSTGQMRMLDSGLEALGAPTLFGTGRRRRALSAKMQARNAKVKALMRSHGCSMIQASSLLKRMESKRR